MKLISIIALFLLFVPCASAQQLNSHKDAIPIVADQYYWFGPEENLGIELMGKFNSLEQLEDTFSLSKEIGLFKAKKLPNETKSWKLRDILISVDFNANGNVATWRVSGPKPLILDYVRITREEYEDHSVFYDFSYKVIDFKPTAFFEREN